MADNLDLKPVGAATGADIDNIEKSAETHIEDGAHPSGSDADAILAERAEHDMSLGQSLVTHRKAILWSMAISLVIVMDGYDTGLLSSINGLPTFRRRYGVPSAKGYQLTAAWQTAITEAPIVGNIIGIFVSSIFQDRLGYKRTIQIFLVALTGFIFIVFYAPTVEVLFAGLLLCGLPWGAFSSSAVSYASEVTPIHLRGYLTTYVNLCWIAGQFIATGVLKGVSDRNDEWGYRIPFALQWMWPVPLFVVATLAPESPWFYVRKGRLEDAERSVSRLAQSSDDVQASHVVAMMVRTNDLEKRDRPQNSYLDCFKGKDRRRTEIACVAWAAQILSGTTFANNPVYFLQQAGFDTKNSFNVGLGAKALAVVGTCGSWVTLTYFGRRTVFVTGLAICSLCLLLVGAISFPAETSTNAAWGSAAMVLVWVFVYDFTVGPVAYTIVGESSSTRLRSKTVGLGRISYNISRIVAGFLYSYQVNPSAWNWKGKAGFFWGGTAFLAFVWAYFRLPEFKDRSFRELDILFSRGISARRFKETEVVEDDDA